VHVGAESALVDEGIGEVVVDIIVERKVTVWKVEDRWDASASHV
jgi:hypothetical protein